MMNPRALRVTFGPALVAALALGLIGCDGEHEIKSYRAPREPSATPAMASDAPPMPPAAASRVVWDLPEGWTTKPTTQAMRLATFDAGGVEVAVTAFPGDVGGDLANVNRWRGQMGLAAVDEAALPGMLRSATPTTSAGPVKVSLINIRSTGEPPQELAGAIITPGDGQTWFLKATASPDKVAAIMPAFEKLAASFRLKAGESPASPSASMPPAAVAPALPPADAAINPHAQPKGTIEARLSGFKLPANWKAETIDGGFITAAFAATNNDGGARITATSLLKDGGGTLANINRWRDQVGLPAAPDLASMDLKDIGPGTTMVDLAKADGTSRMISIIVPAQGSTWFFKLTGGPKGVEAERRAFEAFAREVGLGVSSPSTPAIEPKTGGTR